MINTHNKDGSPADQQLLTNSKRGTPLPTMSARNKAPAEMEMGYYFNRVKPPETGELCNNAKDEKQLTET